MYQKFTCLLISLQLLSSFVADGFNVVGMLPGFTGELPFKLETGYVGIGENKSIQLYYYFVESEGDPLSDPLLLWHTGGPGYSVLSSIVYEIGPLQFDYKAFNGSVPPLITNPHAFTKVANILFIDAPVGTGFSYAENNKDYYIKDDVDAAEANYQFLQKWLSDHPKFQNNTFYLSGSSYGGKIVPILAHKIHTDRRKKQFPKINLQGYILGNPATYKVMEDGMQIQCANRLGFIPDELYESIKRNCGDRYLYPGIQNELCRKDLQVFEECTKLLTKQHVLEPICTYDKKLNDHQVNNTLKDIQVSIDDIIQVYQGKKPWCRKINYKLSEIWANDPKVQKALYVRKGTKDIWKRLNTTIMNSYPSTIVASVVDYHQHLFNSGYRALIYSGDHDMQVSYISTLKWIASLNLTIRDAWRPWIVEKQEAGYTRTYTFEDSYELTFATLKGAGHIAPDSKPKEVFEMFNRWIAYSKL